MPELGLGREEPECRRLEVEPTAEHAVGSNTATVAVVFVVAVVAVVEMLTTVERCSNTWDYTLGSIVESSCQDSFLQKHASQVILFYSLQCYHARKRYNCNEIKIGSLHLHSPQKLFFCYY